jgi:putative acetyltransferase
VPNTQQRPFTVREMRPEVARAFLEVHHAAVRGTAAGGCPPAVIEAWAPMPLTDNAIERVRANPEHEYRLIAEVGGRVLGIGALVFEKSELRACYVTPEAGAEESGQHWLGYAADPLDNPGTRRYVPEQVDTACCLHPSRER